MTQDIILLRQNLAIEPDVQNFIGFILTTVKDLGGSAFLAVLGILNIVNALRNAGAGTGYPLPAALVLKGTLLAAEWGEDQQALILRLETAPPPQAVERLKQYFQRSTESADPTVLLKRNAEMTRYLDETRKRTEAEIEAMQRTLTQRQAELHESIREAETDSLTGLQNRRAYDEKLAQAFHRTTRQQSEVLSLVLFDLDYFKQINDEFGHQYGDAYLNKMAQAMMGVIRHGVDGAFRFGGDEFAILLFARKDVARDKSMDLLVAMDNKVSIGIASISVDEPCQEDLAHFIQRADNALYEAKRAGRGRIVVDTCHADGSVTWEHCLPPSLKPQG